MKQRISDQISEDTFKCQDLASTAGKNADSLCPFLDNSTQYCSTAQQPMVGELGLVMDRIKQNGCLFSDLEKGLPATAACSSQSGNSTSTVCLAGVQKVANLLEAEYQKSRGSAQRLSDSLKIEKARISSASTDLAKKISIVIDALAKGVTSSSGTSTAPTVDPKPPVQDSKPLLIYNGESAPFVAGQGWDITQSTVTESTAKPASGTSHLRFTLNNKNFWGAAAYAWNNYQALDLSGYRKITFKARSPQAASIKLFLVAMETNSESIYTDFTLTKSYQTYTIDLDALKAAGFDLSSPQALVVATSLGGEASYTIDIDDITTTL